MELRPTRYDHPDAIALTEEAQRYYLKIYGEPDTDPLGPKSFLPPGGGFLIGYVDDLPVAMGGWLFSQDTPRADDAQIRRMFVDPVMRNRGFGRRLLAALEVDAAGHGAKRTVLTTGTPQTGAVALYRAAGYVDIEPFGYYGDEPNAVCLARVL